MTTLKDVAKLAGVSVSTVSIIANGREKERKLSPETIEKVSKAIKELNYRPNVSARSLKYVSKQTVKFVLFWPQDERILMLSSILSGINQKITADKFECQIIVNLYSPNKLCDQVKSLNKFEFQGIIIGGPSDRDLQELNQLAISLPVVLINRRTSHYNSVSVDPTQLAQQAVALFAEKNIKRILTVGITNEFQASNSRLTSFIDLARQNGIEIKPQFKLAVNNSFADGVRAAKYYLHMQTPPKYIFVESDIIAIGMVKEFSKNGLKAREDYSLLSVGSLESSRTLYTTPAISLIDIPSSKISAAAISLLEKREHKTHLFIEPKVLLRETF